MLRSISSVFGVILSLFHLLIGIVAVGAGLIASVQAEVWMAYSVGPIWTGAVFVVTGLAGFLAMQRRTLYLILTVLFLSITSAIAATVSVQLVRQGLVNQTIDGFSYAKEVADTFVLIALGACSLEIFVCLLTIAVALKIAFDVRQEMRKRHEGTFYVQVVGEKEIVVVNNIQSLAEQHLSPSSAHQSPHHGAGLGGSNQHLHTPSTPNLSNKNRFFS